MSTILDETALSEVERIKRESNGLRGVLPGELQSDLAYLSEEAKQILKFHGSYQQEDRDQRKERKKAGLEPAYSFMLRTKLPGGVMTSEQYILHDDLADQFGDRTLRVTTRQGFQLYGILKGNLRPTISGLNDAMVTTLGACGDVVRAVTTCPAPHAGRNREEVIELARRVSDETLPRTRSYHDIWIEGSQVTYASEPEPEPLYGERYLPRKFKIAFAFPEDNCTDIHSNDLGFLVVEREGRIAGYNVLVGGGFGQTHGKAETFARLADTIGFALPEDVLDVAKAVIATQRDHGNRENRKRGRLKYLLHERGPDWFRSEVEARLGRPLEAPAPIEVTGIEDHLGWHEQGDGRLFLGVWIENGRVHDSGSLRLRSALRRIVGEFGLDVHLTTQQNLLLTNVAPKHRSMIDEILREHGVVVYEHLPPVKRYAMACPSTPTCPLGLAEAERVLPSVLDELETALSGLDLADEPLAVRMTGCPNGCARPYTAELAFVGRSLGKYVIYVGGNPTGTRLGAVYADLVPQAELVTTVQPLLERFVNERFPEEGFGDFWTRVGLEPRAAVAKAVR